MDPASALDARTSDQMRVFQSPPAGVIKVVVATNIAETSITIDDVSFVIDTGRLKENRFDPQRKLESLVEDFGSQANLKQRRGRAGRVRRGVCIHLVTSTRFAQLPAQQTPELQRTPLERVVLRAKKLYPHRAVAAVLSELPEPPTPQAIKAACNVLVSLGALERVGGEAPTASGRGGGGGRRAAVAGDDGTERRIDITDGAYTYDEFKEFYESEDQWNMAKPAELLAAEPVRERSRRRSRRRGRQRGRWRRRRRRKRRRRRGWWRGQVGAG